MMKMKNRYIVVFLSLLIGLSACDEREPDTFQNISGIYFNNRSSASALKDSIDVTFVYESGDDMEIPVKIQLLGRPVDESRPVDIRVSSENAVEGTDYVLSDKVEIPAGASSINYIVTLKRTESLKTMKKTIYMELRANDYFALPVTEEIQAGGDTVSTLRYRIIFSDMFTSAPVAWEENLLGAFSQQKFELICDVLDVAPADFNDVSVMTFAMQVYISSEMTQYVKEQEEKKNAGEKFDENAFDGNGDPLTFKKN